MRPDLSVTSHNTYNLKTREYCAFNEYNVRIYLVEVGGVYVIKWTIFTVNYTILGKYPQIFIF